MPALIILASPSSDLLPRSIIIKKTILFQALDQAKLLFPRQGFKLLNQLLNIGSHSNHLLGPLYPRINKQSMAINLPPVSRITVADLSAESYSDFCLVLPLQAVADCRIRRIHRATG
jgi:hypothetical protein